MVTVMVIIIIMLYNYVMVSVMVILINMLYNLLWGKVGLVAKRKHRTGKLSVRFSPVTVELKNEFVIILSPWSLGSDIQRLDFSDRGKKKNRRSRV
jgi:hypothetical protein